MFINKPAKRQKQKPYIIKTRKNLINELIESYYQGQNKFRLSTSFQTSPESIIDIYSNCFTFPFQPSVSCEVQSQSPFAASKKMSLIDLDLSYSQGNRVFISIVNPGFTQMLSNTELMVRDKIFSIASSVINCRMTNKEKAKTVHDYLIDTSEYDSDQINDSQVSPQSYSPYGLLFSHKAVCQAYAETYMLFMTVIGIECYIVKGELLSNNNSKLDNHAWNIIKIDKKYGHVDVTNDNPYPKKILGYKSDRYFYLNDNDMVKTHNWRTDKYPTCQNIIGL